MVCLTYPGRPNLGSVGLRPSRPHYSASSGEAVEVPGLQRMISGSKAIGLLCNAVLADPPPPRRLAVKILKARACRRAFVP